MDLIRDRRGCASSNASSGSSCRISPRGYDSMWAQIISRVLVGVGALQLVACGTYVPPVSEYWDEGTDKLTAGGVLEFKIRQQVYCDIVDAVINVRNQNYLPRGCAVQVTLDLQVD